jgi:hypothetical protein
MGAPRGTRVAASSGLRRVGFANHIIRAFCRIGPAAAPSLHPLLYPLQAAARLLREVNVSGPLHLAAFAHTKPALTSLVMKTNTGCLATDRGRLRTPRYSLVLEDADESVRYPGCSRPGRVLFIGRI